MKPLSRNLWLGGVVLLVAWVTLLGWLALPSRAAPLHQIVQPGDVATPTATSILVPTATVTPVPNAPPLEAALGESLLEAVGVHGAESFITYTVQPGDTLLVVALEVGVDVEDLPCAVSPTFRVELPLVIGDRLDVPPASWHCHQVEADESLTQIAAHYGLDPIQLIEIGWNRLDSTSLGDIPLAEGRYVRVPPAGGEEAEGGFLTYMLEQPLSVSPLTAYAIGGTKARISPVVGPLPKDWPYGSGNFMWPVYGWMSQGYRNDHRAIDIASPMGTYVAASDRGEVIRAGWNDQGYGQFVVIDHHIDYITLYAHLSEIYVKEGEIVEQGQIIGAVGSTGNSTGPHLHFEIRDFGRRANPLDLLVH